MAANIMQFKYTGGFDPTEFATLVVMDDDYTLTDEEKDLFVRVSPNVASKTLTLDLPIGQAMLIANVGSQSVTIKNVADDTGTALAKDKVAFVAFADTEADDTQIYVLN